MSAHALSSVQSPVCNGGRHLDAISLNPNLTCEQKSVLHVIGAKLDAFGDFLDSCWLYVSEIVRRTSLSRRTVFRVLRWLMDHGYIVKQQNQAAEAPQLMASTFWLTAKLFDERAIQMSAEEERRKPTIVPVAQCQADTTLVPDGHGGSVQDAKKHNQSYIINNTYSSGFGKNRNRPQTPKKPTAFSTVPAASRWDDPDEKKPVEQEKGVVLSPYYGNQKP